MKTPFLDFWTKRKERGEILDNRHKIKLSPAQLSTLHSDSDVRAKLQKSRVASLLPPVGSEVFRRFTRTSSERIQKLKSSKKSKQIDEDSSLKPVPELESEKPLPFFYGAPPPELRNVPLEDPDPFYQSQKTFVVVDKGNSLSRFSAGSSCYVFSPFSFFRRAAIKILNHKLFTALVFVTLLVNCFNFLLKAPWTFILELVFLSIYTLEAVLKVFSRGFCLGRFTYLRDSWNRLDFVIVTTGFAFLFVRELRFFKFLRIIKLLGVFPAARRNAKMFGRAVNRLWDVLLLTLLVLSVFAVVGNTLMIGDLSNKCVKWGPFNSSEELTYTGYNNATEFDYSSYISNKQNYYNMNGEPLICGNLTTASSCPDGYTCLRTRINPDFGFTNFDDFLHSFFAMFRLMMRDFWESLAHMAMQSSGHEILIYFVVVLFICSFSLTAVIIVAFTINFTEQMEREIKEAKLDQADHQKIQAALKDKVEDELKEKTDVDLSCLPRICSCDCCDCWQRFKNGLQVFVLDPFFDLAIIILIIMAILFESTIHYPMTYAFADTVSQARLAFTFIFLLEIVLKILAMGAYDFFKVKWHYLDTILVVLTLLELGLADITDLPVLFISLRLFRLGRWWPGLLKWMRLTWSGFCSFWTVSLVLISFFFSLFGMVIFSDSFSDNVCRISDDCELGRWHFNDFWHSFMMVTRAMCGEWVETLWLCMETSGKFSCVVFYVTLLIVANLLIFTLLFTVLMKWVSDKLAPKDEENLKASRLRIFKMLKMCGINVGGKRKEEETVAVDDTEGVTLSHVTSEQTEENGTQSSTLPIGEAQNFQKMKEKDDTEDPEDCCCQKCYRCCPSLNLDNTQGCGRIWAKLRRATLNIIRHPYFDNAIFFIILISSFALVFEDIHLPSHTVLQTSLGYLDQVITYLFVLEVIFKWIGLGFNRYFSDSWCRLDFIITLACVLSVAAQTSSMNLFLISLKAWRPLRILSHIKGTRRSVCSLLTLVPALINVLLVALTVWLFFGLLFVNSFAGKFYFCFNETETNVFTHEEVTNRSQCASLIEFNFTEVRWKNALFNFDSISSAYFSLFSIATMKGWLDLLYSVSDSTQIEEQPIMEKSVYQYLSFLLFWLFGCFFCLIHVLKVLFDAYSSQTQKIGGAHLFLTEKQMKDFNNIRFRTKRPLAPCPRPRGRLRGRLFDLVSRESFEWVMQGVILFTFVLLMIERLDMTAEEEEVLYWLFFVALVIFLLEFLLKITAFGRSYFSDSLNVIDFVALLVQVVGLFIGDLMYYYFIPPQVLYLLRLSRIVRIIHRFPAIRLRLLLSAWSKSLPAIFNLALVLFVLMFCYASFGTFHFSQLQKAASITDRMNFETFGRSLSCMFTIVTWAGWDGLILPALFTPPDCNGNIGECANPALAMTFFLSFLCLSSFVVLVAFLVLLVDMLNVFLEMNCDPLSALNLCSFFKTWRKFVPDSSHFIQRSQLPDLCDKLKEPLWISKSSEQHLDLGPGEQLHCRDVLLALSVQALGDSADKDALKARIDEKYHDFMPNSPSQETCEMSDCTLEMNQEEAATPVTDDAEE